MSKLALTSNIQITPLEKYNDDYITLPDLLQLVARRARLIQGETVHFFGPGPHEGFGDDDTMLEYSEILDFLPVRADEDPDDTKADQDFEDSLRSLHLIVELRDEFTYNDSEIWDLTLDQYFTGPYNEHLVVEGRFIMPLDGTFQFILSGNDEGMVSIDDVTSLATLPDRLGHERLPFDMKMTRA